MTDNPESKSTETKEKRIISPQHVVLFGSGALAAGTVIGAIITYGSGAKELAEEGVDPNTRARFVPIALRTLGLATLLTGCVGALGFAGLWYSGLLKRTQAELLSAQETGRMLTSPRSFFQELMEEERHRAAKDSA